MRPNFAKIEWSDFVEFVDSNLTEYGRPNFAKFKSQKLQKGLPKTRNPESGIINNNNNNNNNNIKNENFNEG